MAQQATQFDQAQIQMLVSDHLETSTDIKSTSGHVVAQAEQTAQASASDMTTAVVSLANNWQEAMSQVCSQLNQMAETLSGTSKAMVTNDSDNASIVQGLNSGLTGFLGG